MLQDPIQDAKTTSAKTEMRSETRQSRKQ